MVLVYDVPLVATPQTVSVFLKEIEYNLTVKWCVPANCWVIDIADGNNNPIVSGIPMICGADLLAQYAYLGIGGQLIAQSNDNLLAPPTFENLGSIGQLYFVTPQ